MGRPIIYVPANSPDVWQTFLADPQLHWKTGYSARTLAHAWHAQHGFPPEIQTLFNQSNFAAFQNMIPLLVLPEYKVPLKGHGKDSQNDLYVLAKASDNQLVSITVEGKVEESFGTTIQQWKQSSKGFSENKHIRLTYLQEQLGLEDIPATIYYQLLHRSASAVIEAKRYNAKYAVMLVHSFSRQSSWFDEYAQFIALYGQVAVKDKLFQLRSLGDIELFQDGSQVIQNT